MNSFLAKIREEAVQNLTEAERQQLRPWLEARLTPEESIDTTPRPTVRNWALEDLLPLADRTAEPNAPGGAEVFALARCVQCHRFGTRGTPIGPDLTSVSRRFSRRDLLTSIVEPSRVIAENYRSLQIVTKGGRTHVGQATLGGDYRSSFLRLSTDATRPFEFVEIPKGEIESQQESSVSWMPTGLLDTFNLDEIFDLLMYLESSP